MERGERHNRRRDRPARQAETAARLVFDLIEVDGLATHPGAPPLAILATAASGALVELTLFASAAAARAAVPPGAESRPDLPSLPEVRRQLAEYFAGRRRVFDLPLAPRGTDFEQRVWQALQSIPYGETRSYAEIAAIIGRPTACRAVGHANGSNPLPIVVPCHRVIGSDGSLTGYGGGLELKRFLLELESGTSGTGVPPQLALPLSGSAADPAFGRPFVA